MPIFLLFNVNLNAYAPDLRLRLEPNTAELLVLHYHSNVSGFLQSIKHLK